MADSDEELRRARAVMRSCGAPVGSDEELMRARAAVRSCGVAVGDWWRHSKRGTVYVIVLLTLDEATFTPVVHYRDVTAPPDEIPWSRAVTEFLGNIVVDQDELVPRFVRVQPTST